MLFAVPSLVLLTALAPRAVFPPDTPHRSVLSSSGAQPFVLASELPPPLHGAQSPSSKDRLKNGAIIGAIAGGVSGFLLMGFGCEATEGIDDLLSGRTDTTDGDCAGPMIIGTIAGAGLGALIGIGVDAMFERAPHPRSAAGGVRKGIRLSFRF